MDIDVRKSATLMYRSVQIKEGETTIDLGYLDEKERRELAQTFITAAEELLDGLRDESEGAG